VGRERALALLADWTLVAFLVDVPALAALAVMFFFFPDAPLRETGFAAFCLELLLFLARDTTGGLSRKWMGMKIEDSRGRNPGFLRSICRNLPLLVPGWNLYAVGSNRVAANLSGISVKRTVLGAYVVSSVFAGLGGLLLLGYTESVFLNLADQYTLPSVAAVGGSWMVARDRIASGDFAGITQLTAAAVALAARAVTSIA